MKLRSFLLVLTIFFLVIPPAIAQKNCTKGKRCGNTCISISYTCRIGGSSSSSGSSFTHGGKYSNNATTSEPSWVDSATQAFSEALEQPVTYFRSGPQNVFYVETLTQSVGDTVIPILDTYRVEVEAGGTIVLLGLESSQAYSATPTKSAEQLLNSTMVGYYTNMVSGQ